MWQQASLSSQCWVTCLLPMEGLLKACCLKVRTPHPPHAQAFILVIMLLSFIWRCIFFPPSFRVCTGLHCLSRCHDYTSCFPSVVLPVLSNACSYWPAISVWIDRSAHVNYHYYFSCVCVCVQQKWYSFSLCFPLLLSEVITTSLSDSFPEILVNKRPFVSVGTCILLFLLGLVCVTQVLKREYYRCLYVKLLHLVLIYVCVCVTQAGIYWVVLIDNFSAGWILSILALLEVIGFCYIYGNYK